MLWARLLAYVTVTVNQELLLRNEYLAAENRILRGQIKVDCGRKALEDVAATAKPDTILGWYRKLLANKFDGSKFRRLQGRSGNRTLGCADGEGKSELGLRL